MKMKVLFVFCAMAFSAGFAQNTTGNETKIREHYTKYLHTNDITPVDLMKSPNRFVSINDKGVGQHVLGITLYDLQTNASVQPRLEMDDNGNMAAVWIASESEIAAFGDRGSGYSFFDGSSWTLSPDYPRIESVRSGWPSILFPNSGGEMIISHTTAGAENLKLYARETRGSGTWSEKDVSTTRLAWQRSVMGGADGNTIHMVAVTDAADASKFQGMESALLYYRSKDGGGTFDIRDAIIPGLDSSEVSIINADNYAIAARGDVVAIGVFRAVANDVFILKSVNNGDTWTKTIVYDFPYADFEDFDNNFMPGDTNAVTACDGSGAIMIDGNNNVHVVFGRMKMTNDTLGDEYYTRTIFVDSMIYWNETFGAKKFRYAGHIYDANNNGNSNLASEFSYLGDYRTTNIISMPTMALGMDGKIWIAYSALTENYDDGSSPITNLRHIYLIHSDNNGTSWSEPLDLNEFDPFVECVYPSLYKNVDDKIRLTYQRDNVPSVVLVEPPATSALFPRHTYQNSVTDNEIVYYEIGPGQQVGVETVLNRPAAFSLYPNPAFDWFTITTAFNKPTMVKVLITNMTGDELLKKEILQGSDHKSITVDVDGLSPGIYFVTIVAEGKQVTKKLAVC